MADGVAGALAAKELLDRDERLRKKIFAHAYSLTRNMADAKELSQDAILKTIDPDQSPWDPDEQPNLLLHVGSVMNSAMANRRRGEARHPFIPYVAAKDTRVDPAPTAEDRMMHEDEVSRLERWMDDLRAGLAGDDVALGKINLLYRGVDDAASQAEHLGCTVGDIYRANERIAAHVERIKTRARAATARASLARPTAPEPAESETEVES